METPYHLIIKFLHEKCTPEEIQALITWRQSSSKNEAIYLELLHTWNYDHCKKGTEIIPSKAKVWSHIQSHIDIDNEIFPTYSKRYIVKAITIAASIALIIGLSIPFAMRYIKLPSPISYVYVETPLGQKSHIILSDGTKVWLNSGSKIAYSSDYNKKSRMVKLTGEAFFDVVHNSQRPFIVNTGKINVKVLGTAFDVHAYPNDTSIEVSLLRGSLSVESAIDQTQIGMLHPNQKATINQSNLLCAVSDCNAANDNIWINNQLKFEGVTTDEMFKQLDRWFGVDIADINIPKDKRYWLTLKTESLTETLQLINKITPINYTINGEEVQVKFKP
jgi:ferric-dicitrate binding protein FerR (iron transport regulator)